MSGMTAETAEMQDRAGPIEALGNLVGCQYVLTTEDDQEPHVVDWHGRYHGRAVAVVKPANTEQVAAVVRHCAEKGVGVLQPERRAPRRSARNGRTWCGSPAQADCSTWGSADQAAPHTADKQREMT